MRKALCILLALSLLLSCSAALAWGESNADKYEKALDLLAENKFTEAAEAFAALGHYSDAPRYTMYARALAAGADGSYSLAVETLKVLDDFLDSRILITYFTALSYEAAEEYEKAEEIFGGITLYGDVSARVAGYPDLINARDYRKADANENAGRLEDALTGFTALGDYSDSADRAAAVQAKIDAREAERIAAAPKTVGAYVTLGTYPQTAAGNDHTPIEWLVLDYDEANNRSLLISRYGLDAKPYHADEVDVTWETCTLRTWLNSVFLNTAFSADEQNAIVLTDVDNSKAQGYSGWSTDGGNNTQDRLFLLSYAEAWKYFADDNARMCAPTDYAVKQGVQTSASNKADGRATGWWWLRSPGREQICAALVLDGGALSYGLVVDVRVAVRPALWIDLNSGIF